MNSWSDFRCIKGKIPIQSCQASQSLSLFSLVYFAVVCSNEIIWSVRLERNKKEIDITLKIAGCQREDFINKYLLRVFTAEDACGFVFFFGFNYLVR